MNSVYHPSGNEVEIFEHCYKNKLPLLLKGPTGCGKSQLVQYMAERLNQELIKVACNEDTNSADLLGRFLIRGAETVWQDGPVSRAARSGTILYLDEIAEAREDVMVALHPLTDHRREIYLDRINEVIQASERFMCVASYNPGYQRGFRELKSSTRQRFVHVALSYLNVSQEAALISELTQLAPSESMQLAQVAARIRGLDEYNLKETVSTRLLVYAATLIKAGMNSRKACHASLAEALSDDREIVTAIKDLIDLSL